MIEIKGIDVSSEQDKPDWARVAASGVKFAILRVHQRYGIDASFEHNYKGCRNNGILIGGYKYSYALNAAQAEAEADAVLAVLAGRGLDFPIFYDLEWDTQREQCSRTTITKIAKAFLTKIAAAGYKVGIYCGNYWYNSILDTGSLPYEFWVSNYPYPEDDNGTLQERLRPKAGVGWQYSAKGTVPGISGPVDLDLFFKDYKEEAKPMKHGQAAVDLALSRKGKNQYTQTYLREQVFAGWSDCSSLAWKCFEKAYGLYIGSWTGEQVERGRQIIKRSSAVPYVKITQAELNKMQPGDLIFYGAGSAYHVEIYMGGGQQIGHGSGIGPTVKNCLEYAHSHGFYQVRRYVDDDTKTPAPATKWKATGTATSTGDDVKVRATPGGAVLRSVNKGNRFEIDGTVVSGWVHANVAGIIGYIYEQYVQPDKTDTTKPADTYRLFVGKVTASELSVRSWYGKDGNGKYYPQIKSYPVLKQGNLVDVLVEYKYGSETWYKVRIAGKYIGFVHGSYIKRR